MSQENSGAEFKLFTSKSIAVLLWVSTFALLSFYELFLLFMKLIFIEKK